MKHLLVLLKQRGFTIGACESLTAGLFTSQVASVPGASQVLKGGIVTYQTALKQDLLNVDPMILNSYGVISEEMAKQMASRGKALLGVDVCVSFTGNAGPEVMEGKPAGMVCCAIACKDECISFTRYFQGSRNEVREACVKAMVEEVIVFLER